MSALDDLEAKVAANTSAVSSAVTLLQTLNAELKAAAALGDPAQALARVQAVTAQIDANTQAWANAVAANTPAAPTP